MKSLYFFLILCIFIFFINNIAYCQQKIILKDNSILYGKIIEMKNNMYSIKTKSFGLVKVNADNIISITKVDYHKTSDKIHIIHKNNNYNKRKQYRSETPNYNQTQIDTEIQNKLTDSNFLNQIMDLSGSQEINDILSDPDIMNAINNNDYNYLMNNSKIQNLMNTKEIQNILGNFEQ